MSVIQTLREKYATVVVIVVCISLVAFLLMDAFVGPSSFFSQDMEVVVVDGVGYDYNDFMQRVKQMEDNYRNQNPDVKMTDEVRNQIKQQVYNQFVEEQILQEEYDKLGIAFAPEELRMLTITADADPQIKQIPAFQNPQTGSFDPNRVIQFIQGIKNAPANDQQAQMQRYQWMQMEEMLRNSALVRKFFSLVTNGIYMPEWLSKEKLDENDEYADISFVSSAYASIPDSAVEVSTEELQDYLEKHKKQFQVEASRSVEFVSFDAVPSSEDSARILSNIKALSVQFDSLDNSDIAGFISRNSEKDFLDRFVPESKIQSDVKQELIDLPAGKTFGPYFDNNSVNYARIVGKSKVPNSVTIQQLMISNQMVTDSIARFRADSIKNAVQSGADFTLLINEYSQGQAQNEGKISFSIDDENIPDEFAHFATGHQVGALGIIVTKFGYHVVKVLDKEDVEDGYKIAYLSAGMDPSQQTDNAVYSEANRFRGLNQTREEFESTAREKGYNIQVAGDFQGNVASLNNLPSSRDIVQWAFKADLNDVSKVFVLPKKYVIAVLTGITQKGTAPLQDVRPQIEAAVRRQKKAQLLADKMKGNSLRAMATSLNDSVSAGNGISFVTPFIPNSGFEPKVVGAAFNESWIGDNISTPIFGENGVYVLQVDSIYAQVADSSALAQIKTRIHNQLQQQVSGQLRDVLIKEADIKDRRLEFPGL